MARDFCLFSEKYDKIFSLTNFLFEDYFMNFMKTTNYMVASFTLYIKKKILCGKNCIRCPYNDMRNDFGNAKTY